MRVVVSRARRHPANGRKGGAVRLREHPHIPYCRSRVGLEVQVALRRSCIMGPTHDESEDTSAQFILRRVFVKLLWSERSEKNEA